jgi:hypothetical protein
MIKKQYIIIYIEIVISYIISYDIISLYIVIRYNELRIALPPYIAPSAWRGGPLAKTAIECSTQSHYSPSNQRHVHCTRTLRIRACLIVSYRRSLPTCACVMTTAWGQQPTSNTSSVSKYLLSFSLFLY